MKKLIALLAQFEALFDKGVKAVAKFIKAKTESKSSLSEEYIADCIYLAIPFVLVLLNIFYMKAFGAVVIIVSSFLIGWVIGKYLIDAVKEIARMINKANQYDFTRRPAAL